MPGGDPRRCEQRKKMVPDQEAIIGKKGKRVNGFPSKRGGRKGFRGEGGTPFLLKRNFGVLKKEKKRFGDEKKKKENVPLGKA